MLLVIIATGLIQYAVNLYNHDTNAAGPTKSQVVSQTAHQRLSPTRELIQFKTKAREGNLSVKELENSLPLIFGSELAADQKVIFLFRNNIRNFRPETLAAILTSWPELKSDTIQWISNQPTEDLFLNVMNFIPTAESLTVDNSKIAFLRVEILREVALGPGFVTPESVEKLMEELGPLSNADKVSLGQGLATKISRISNIDERMKMFDLYYKHIHDPLLLQPMVGAAVSPNPRHQLVVDSGEALKWLSGLDPTVTAIAERTVLSSLDASQIHAGVAYSNKLFENGHIEQAKKASESLVESYSKANSREAYEWVMSVPAEKRTPQMVTTSFVALCREHPAEAEAIAKEGNDDNLNQLFNLITNSKK